LIELRCQNHDGADDNDEQECDEDGDRGPNVVGINQIVWDIFANTLHVESDALLKQHTRYAVIVTRGVRDESGAPVEATEAFRRFRLTVPGEYKHALLEAIHAARRLSVRERDIVTASVFTTQSVTAILEEIRNQIKAATPEPADFILGAEDQRTVFPLNTVTGITFNQQTRMEGPLNPVAVPIGLLGQIGQIDTIAFGKFHSPDYQVHPGEFIPPVGTRTGTPVVQEITELYFNLFLPAGEKPVGGWPVAIFGHGGGNNKNALPFSYASNMAAHGIATIAINNYGQGFGPRGTVTVNQKDGTSVIFLAGGRGRDQDGDGTIGNQEGFSAAPPRTILKNRDGFRHTAVDLMQLVRVLQTGMDVDGEPETVDLDASRIYLLGHSQGGMYGTLLLAVEPSVRTGGLTSAGPGDPFILHSVVSGSGPLRTGIYGTALARRVPSLINSPGVTHLDGVSIEVAPFPSGPFFNDNMPLRDSVPLNVRLTDGSSYEIRSPVINSVAGASEIQQVIENEEWAFQSGDLVAYAPYLRKHRLPGVPAKSVIYFYGKGDQTTPNPQMTALLRAGDLADRATFFRNDLAYAADSRINRNPHNVGHQIADPIMLARDLARAVQRHIGIFFASDGNEVINPDSHFFEVPIVLPLPERLSYIRDTERLQ